mmetsp:Transcript_27053/g.68432  ORF Transcript_27053/g.68432 Transcript_27053/m.68432 type:complete len:346 (+) Transcript_27053:113-1150(+)
MEAQRIGRDDPDDAGDDGDAEAFRLPRYVPRAVRPSAVSLPPAPLWPAELPNRVREARKGAWGCAAFWLALEVALQLSSPHSDLRRWLSIQGLLRGGLVWVLVYLGSLAWALWLLVTCAWDPGYLTPGTGLFEDELAPSDRVNFRDQPYKRWLADLPLRWCDTCRLMQPRRTKHCKECGLCVRTFDHHCFWIGGCVGELNHRHFLGMLASWSAVLLWHWSLVWSCRTGGGGRHASLSVWFEENWEVVFMLVVGAGFIVMTVGLLVYHSYLMVTSQTTWEHLSRREIDYLRPFPRTVFPFSLGALENARRFLTRSRTSAPQDWEFTWERGQPIPFNIWENKWWSCC